MKINKFFAVAIAATTILASCAKEQGNGGAQTGVDTYAGISVSFPKMTTVRAVTPDVNATTAEQAVTSVGVYVVDDNSGAMHSKVYASTEFISGTGNGDTPNAELYYLKTALKTTTGTKSIYVVLNPTSTVTTEIAAKRGTIFSTASIAADETAFVNGTTDMVMSSTAAATKTLGIVNETDALLNTNLVPITVQRNTAKVAVTYNSTVVDGTFTLAGGTGTASSLQFAPITTAKNSYLIQQLATGQTTISVANVRTPGYDVTAATMTVDNVYWTKVAAPATYQAVLASTTANTALNGFYALENVNGVNLVGNTTAAIIKANIAPAAGTVITGYAIGNVRTLGNYTTGEDFYVKKSDNTVWTVTAYDQAVAADLTAAHFSKPYVSGVSYYRIWVQDATGVKGVLRNNYYVMQVNSISGFGSPTVPGVNPDDPTEPEDPKLPIDEDAYISVSVSVANWEVVPSGHDL